MKKSFLILLCAIVLLGVTGCGNEEESQEKGLQANDFSGIWVTSSGNTTYYFDCTGKYKWTTHQTNDLDKKGKTFASYGTYEINGDSIVLDGEKKEIHFLKVKDKIYKDTICVSNGDCFDKSSSSTCEKLEEITKEN